MREIKFRGWSENQGKWLYGFPMVDKGMPLIRTISCGKWLWVLVDPKSVGQMVLKFKDGSGFYEGDIVECCDEEDIKHIRYIKWHGGDYPAYDINDEVVEEQHNINYFINWGGIKVIGNLYQNPELLEIKNGI